MEASNGTAASSSSASASSSSSRKALTIAGVALGTAALGYVGYKLSSYVSKQLERKRMVCQYRQQLVCSLSHLQALKQDFLKQLEQGMREEMPPTGRNPLMLPTYVTQLPTGYETGEVYAIDLGGTNFRVMHVQLSEERSKLANVDSHEVAIPKEVYTGTGEGLFDFLAAELKCFIDKHQQARTTEGSSHSDGPPVVGFCFSFPMKQSALNKGILLDWTKGFTCSGVVGEDPVRLLSEALERAGRPCHVAALLNDTVGVLAAHRYLEPSTSVGVIIGTGTNACYVDLLARLTKWDAGRGPLPAGTQTAINTEWGGFDSPLLPRCPEDDHVDEATSHTGKYIFEKLVSGMFLGEVARRILLNLAANTGLLGDVGRDPEAARLVARLATHGAFTTAHVARVVRDDSRLLEDTARVLGDALGATPRLAPFSSRQLVREVCGMVALRSAQMVAVALDAILTHTRWSAAAGDTTIAFDGGVYEKFEAYRHMLAATLAQLRGAEDARALHLALSHDGSCLGAAVVAAAALREDTHPAGPAAATAVGAAADAGVSLELGDDDDDSRATNSTPAPTAPSAAAEAGAAAPAPEAHAPAAEQPAAEKPTAEKLSAGAAPNTAETAPTAAGPSAKGMSTTPAASPAVAALDAAAEAAAAAVADMAPAGAPAAAPEAPAAAQPEPAEAPAADGTAAAAAAAAAAAGEGSQQVLREAEGERGQQEHQAKDTLAQHLINEVAAANGSRVEQAASSAQAGSAADANGGAKAAQPADSGDAAAASPAPPADGAADAAPPADGAAASASGSPPKPGSAKTTTTKRKKKRAGVR